jgi:hypothetical protein
MSGFPILRPKAVGLHPANQPFHPERSGASIITWPTVARR